MRIELTVGDLTKVGVQIAGPVAPLPNRLVCMVVAVNVHGTSLKATMMNGSCVLVPAHAGVPLAAVTGTKPIEPMPPKTPPPAWAPDRMRLGVVGSKRGRSGWSAFANFNGRMGGACR